MVAIEKESANRILLQIVYSNWLYPVIQVVLNPNVSLNAVRMKDNTQKSNSYTCLHDPNKGAITSDLTRPGWWQRGPAL